VPLDGSANSSRALQYALDLAKRYGASITLLHIVERPIYAYGYPEAAMIPGEDVYLALRREGEKLLSERKGEVAAQGIPVETSLVTGDPSEEILKASEASDLIVMGSRGLGRVKSLLLGSVSSKVSHYVKKPVLVIRPE